MLQGRFGNTSGRPYMEGRVAVSATNQYVDVSFLFDTGADMTLLMPVDSLRLGIDFNDTKYLRVPMNGVGGAAIGILLPGLVAFRGTSGKLYVYQTMLFVAEPTPQIKDVPSLLGRNIIDRWNVIYAPRNAALSATVLTADYTFDPTPGAAPPFTPSSQPK